MSRELTPEFIEAVDRCWRLRTLDTQRIAMLLEASEADVWNARCAMDRVVLLQPRERA